MTMVEDEKEDTSNTDLRGKSEEGFLAEAKKRAKASNDVFKASMEQGQKDLKIFIAKDPLDQWDSAIKDRRVGRPMLTENLLPMFHKRVAGNFRMNTPATKVLALDSKASPETADIVRGLFYNIRYQSQADVIHQRVFDHMLLTGFGCWGLTTQFIDDSSFEKELRIEGFKNQFAVRIDPSFEMPDTSDKKFALVYQTLNKEQFEEKFPDEEFIASTGFESSVLGTSKESWESEEKCQVAKYWYMNQKPKTLYELKSGEIVVVRPGATIPVPRKDQIRRSRAAFDREVYCCLISPGKVLTEPVRWVDDNIIPIFYVFGELFYLDGEMVVKSFIKDAIQTQQIHNYNITALIEQVALQPDAPWLLRMKMIEKYKDIWDGKTKSRYLPWETDPAAPNDKPTREAPPELSQGLATMPLYTKQTMHDILAMPEAVMGQKSNEKSGVAVKARAAQGDVAGFVYISNFNLGLTLESKLVVETIPDVYDSPRVVRILGIDGEQKLAHIKQQDPQNPSAKIIDPSVGKYGTAVEVGPSLTTQRQEARETLLRILEVAGQANPQAVAAVFPKVVKATDMPDAKEIAEIFAATLETTQPEIFKRFYAEKEGGQQYNVPPELMQQMKQMQEQLLQYQQVAEAAGKEIETLKNKERVEMAKIQANKELKQAEIDAQMQATREEYAFKEHELLVKRDVDLEKIRAQMAADLGKHELEQELRAVERLQAQEKPAAEPAPAAEVP